jgi:hypothetical protein
MLTQKMQAREPYLMNMPYSSSSSPDLPQYISYSTNVKE